MAKKKRPARRAPWQKNAIKRLGSIDTDLARVQANLKKFLVGLRKFKWPPP
jgi:hypothetical protein